MGKKFEDFLVAAAEHRVSTKGKTGTETRHLMFARNCVIEHGIEELKRCVFSHFWKAEFALKFGSPSSFKTREYLKTRFEEKDE